MASSGSNTLIYNGRYKIFAGIFFIVLGILVFIFFNQLCQVRLSIWGLEVIEYPTTTFGPYGCAGFFVFCGAGISLNGFAENKREKKEKFEKSE